MKIGQLAMESGVAATTIRYYEKQGLLPEPVRRSSGYRIYKEEALSQLQLIKAAQALGFSLDEVSKLLGAKQELDHEDVIERLRAKRSDIDTMFQQLTEKKKMIDVLIGRLEQLWVKDECMDADEIRAIIDQFS